MNFSLDTHGNVSAMNTTSALPGLDEIVADLRETGTEAAEANPALDEPPRLRRPDRRQVLLEPVCWEERLAADHPARAVWAVVERLDLSRIADRIAARGESPGRAATDPRLLVALWLYATIENVGSARSAAAERGCARFTMRIAGCAAG